MENELERNCWYWYTDPREGDVWYPCWLQDDGNYLIDGRVHPPVMVAGLTFIKAVLPE